ncbi:twin-arginine translocase subunit TatC [Dissulfurirhabdus thermomarina]|uniref:Sec-independent protein translocase protein TatC n=1 Tax=Dissulfurirhabdus thermomarina TaxID=1765737 RepID=A0A6N9TPN1_DISTH|nr:twin-arginine translocase subunit TatC [Dissulfurirhabdus thermomarina]NDY43225.1 twin-arginine translocase subunit TatC [Dissulfurirhabdus thermomarina]NMX22346.1 twin-arginine translocase subunit TatC [Dissulfurirhabdus thermomarina]
MSLESFPFKAHLGEIRRRLIACVVVLGVAFAACYALSGPLVAFLGAPLRTVQPGQGMVFTALPEAFLVYLKVAFWAALILSAPFFVYQAWAFVAPGLYPHEKRRLRWALLWGGGLFVAGAVFGYAVVLPAAFSITMDYASEGLQALPRLQDYMLFSLKAMFVFGLVFEIPFLMMFAVRSGLVAPDYFRRGRKGFYVALYLVAVLVVPSDVFTQVLIFLPMMALYEVGRWMGGRRGPSAGGAG